MFENAIKPPDRVLLLLFTRHVGDLGNIEEDGSGSVVELKTDSMITFEGTNDITERAIVVCTTPSLCDESRSIVCYLLSVAIDLS